MAGAVNIVPRMAERAAAVAQTTPKDILGRCRRAPLSHSRQAIMLVLRERGWSLPRIGRELGRDHSTVCTGLVAARGRMRANPVYAALVRDLEAIG